MNESTQKWFQEWSNEYDQTLGNKPGDRTPNYLNTQRSW